MKTIVIIFVFLFTLKGIAQDPELFENTWYLERLNINDIDYIPPINAEIDEVTLVFFENPYVLETVACETLSSDLLTNFTLDSFTTIDFTLLFDDCVLQETIDFQNLYYVDFFPYGDSPYVFTYVITTNGSNKVLTITNAANDFAVYNSESLSNPFFTESRVIVYPSPVKDELRFSTQESILSVTIYNILGEKLLFVDEDFEVLDLSQLPSGILILDIVTEKGKVIKKK